MRIDSRKKEIAALCVLFVCIEITLSKEAKYEAEFVASGAGAVL